MINTTRSGKVLDIFYIQNAANQPFGFDDPYLMDALVGYLQCVAAGTLPVERSREMRLKRSDAAQVTPYLNFSNDLSDVATVIEALSGTAQACSRTCLTRSPSRGISSFCQD